MLHTVEMALWPCPEKESLKRPLSAKHGMTIDRMKTFRVENDKEIHHECVQRFLYKDVYYNVVYRHKILETT